MTAQSGERSARQPGREGAGAGRGCYVYGIVADPSPEVAKEIEDLPAVADPEASLTFVRHDGIAAVISEVPVDVPLGRPDDLQAHARALDTLAAAGTAVLPLRFGTVVRDPQAVADELLAGGHDDFAAALERLAGHAQFTMKARYVQDAVLREVLTEQPVARQLRDELAEMPEDAGYYQRVELGQIVSDAIAAKREADCAELLRRLEPFADASVEGRPPSGDEVVNASFLVAHRRRAAFEEAAEQLARDWHGRVQLRLLGPLAPYEFVSAAMGETGPAAGEPEAGEGR